MGGVECRERQTVAQKKKKRREKKRIKILLGENRNTLVGDVQDYWTIINNLVSVGFIFL